jgi:AraC-like DNA-binding protein
LQQPETFTEPRPAGRFAPRLAWAGERLDAPLTVEDMAEQAGMSSRHFARAFITETGTTPSKAVERQGAATKAADAATNPSAPRLPADGRLRDEQTRDRAYSADLNFIELERARGNLIPVADFDPLAQDAASRICDIVDSLHAQDSELTAIAIKEGENGMRAALKRITRAQRTAIVDAMKDMAAVARAASAASGTPNTNYRTWPNITNED